MKLHENKELFSDAIMATAQQFNIQEIYIEKDYWVSLALYKIFKSGVADKVVFKGGTALSKCYQLIDRFSEDIDLVIIRNDEENDNQIKKNIRSVSKIIEPCLPEIEIEGLTNKKGQIRKTAHQYLKTSKGIFGQIREQIILEVMSLGNFEPNHKCLIKSYITQMLQKQEQLKLIDSYNMDSFEVRVLNLERIFCEKIMGLVRFSYQEMPYGSLSNKIRHLYDLNRILMQKEIQVFLKSKNFDIMLQKVGNDDVLAYKNNNYWLKTHPKEAIIFSESEKTWNKIRSTYFLSFKDIVYGKLPDESSILSTINTISQKLCTIEWDIHI